jgi:type IV pilus assembly protein PilV
MFMNGTRIGGAWRNGERGFSLIEVMVALAVCGIGMLGLAKMASLGLASTTVSSTRALVALEAGGMAASMHANRAYWASTSATTGATITGSAPNVTDINLANGPTCYNTLAAPCAPIAVAGFDARSWGQTLYNMIPSYTANIVCTPTATPVTCTITVTWAESAVAVDTRQTGITQSNFTATQQPTYTLYVEP